MTQRQKRTKKIRRWAARRSAADARRRATPDFKPGDLVIDCYLELDPALFYIAPKHRRRVAKLEYDMQRRWWVAFNPDAAPQHFNWQWDEAWVQHGWQLASAYQKAPPAVTEYF